MHSIKISKSKIKFSKPAVLCRWQADVLKQILEQDDRKIMFVVGELFVVDKVGGKNKTFLTKNLMANHGACVFYSTAMKVCAYSWKVENIVIFDLSRSVLERINYGRLECFKNSIVFCAKYESQMK